MQVWILQTPRGRLHGNFHRETANDCPKLLEGGGEEDELVLVEIEDVPRRQKACQSPGCFAGVERAEQLYAATEVKEAKFEPIEATSRVRLKPATRGSRPKTRSSKSKSRSSSARPAAPPPPPKPRLRRVAVDSVVTFTFLDTGETKTLKLVKGAASLTDGEISAETPYGKAMLGADTGETVMVELPGRKREVEIVEFSVPWED